MTSFLTLFFAYLIGALVWGVLLLIARALHRQAPIFLCLLGIIPGAAVALGLTLITGHDNDIPVMGLAGFLLAPTCLLPLALRRYKRASDAARAARGLGASRLQQARFEMLPFYRAPLFFTILLTLISFSICAGLGWPRH